MKKGRWTMIFSAILFVFPSISHSSDLMPYTPDKHTVLLLHCDGRSIDCSPFHLPVEASGVKWAENGVMGKAMRCDGSGGVTVGLRRTIDLSGGFTLEAWLNLERPPENTRYLIVERKGSFSWWMNVYPDGNAKVVFTILTDRGRGRLKTVGIVPYRTWVHIACRYDPSADVGQMRIFINGTPAEKLTDFQERETPEGRLLKGDEVLLIGRGLVGEIDEVRISTVPRRIGDIHGTWLSGRVGDYRAIKPEITFPQPPRTWDDRRVWIKSVKAVPTFNSIGLYVSYQGDVNLNSRCEVRYRARDERKWRRGLDLIRCPDDSEFRGSLLILKPGTAYEIKIVPIDPDLSGEYPEPIELRERTWDEEVPIGRVERLRPGLIDEPLIITDRGKPDGWILYTPPEGKESVIDVGTRAPEAILIRDAAYVIVRNLMIRGGTKHGINIVSSHHIWVQRCDISGWGEIGKPGPDGRMVDGTGRVINLQAGVRVGPECSQVSVEHNFIHSPRGSANSWALGHPAGPQGVILWETGGNNVVRYNDIIGCEGHRWNDGIESVANGSVLGGPYRDTDIYGNIIMFANDDGIELDGGQINVRCWHNRIEWTLCGISCAPCIKGPSYVFRNLIANLGDERGMTVAAFKMGGGHRLSPGLNLILHNTVYGRVRGLCSVGYGGDSGYHAISRNNLFAGPKSYVDILDKSDPPVSDFDYDLLGRGGLKAPQGGEEHDITDPPILKGEEIGDYRLAPGSPGWDAGLLLPGVNDDFIGKGPDMGAFEGDSPRFFPPRPDGMGIWPPRVFTRAVRGERRRIDIELIIPSSAGRWWKAISNAPWLRCEPEMGESRGVPQKVSLILRINGESKPGLKRGAVTFRTDLGYNRTIPVEVKLYLKPIVIDLEAEDGKLEGGMVKAKDLDASGGFYICQSPDGPKGKAIYTFKVPKRGVYYVVARCYVPEPRGIHDSFYFSMDGEGMSIWDVQVGPEWEWTVLGERGGRSPCPFNLSAGRHIFKLIGREPETRIDRLVITTNPYPEPPELITESVNEKRGDKRP